MSFQLIIFLHLPGQPQNDQSAQRTESGEDQPKRYRHQPRIA